MRGSTYFRLGLAAIATSFVVSSATVTSLTLSPTDVTSGGTSTATVTLDTNPAVLTPIVLSSSNPSIATVPLRVDLGGKLGDHASFAVRSVAGSAGCSQISARVGTTPPRSELLSVEPPPPSPDLKLTLSTSTVRGSSPVTADLYVTVNDASPATTVQLVSSSESVTVPASVPLQIFSGGGHGGTQFQIATSRVTERTCAVITATHNGVQSRVLLKVLPFFG